MKGSLTMNKRKITYLMSLVTLLTFFSGCNNKIVDEKTYAYADNYDDGHNYEYEDDRNIEVAQISKNKTQIFDEYKHIIQYFTYMHDDQISNVGINEGYGKYISDNVEVPDGYELFDVEPWIQPYIYIEGVGSFTGGNIYYFINNQKVEVTGIYNDEMGIYQYNNPGVPVNEKTLKIEE